MCGPLQHQVCQMQQFKLHLSPYKDIWDRRQTISVPLKPASSKKKKKKHVRSNQLGL